MDQSLIIVESIGKIKKINDYLGDKYIVKASLGHCIDLDPNNISVDLDNNYKPNYIIVKGKYKIINELKKSALDCKSVILATDNDREGEAIAWELSNSLNLIDPPRIIFSEITYNAIQNAILNPKVININKVYAQQTRRIYDRLIGYKISPLLQQLKDINAKSVGRVQSILVKIVKEKEDEINNFNITSYIKIIGELIYNKEKIKITLQNNVIENLDLGKHFLNKFNKNIHFVVTDIQNKNIITNPLPPFITSTLQHEAFIKLKFNVSKTMLIAQKLYEEGYITYMRTDSCNLSEYILNKCKDYIIRNFGSEYYKYNIYTLSNFSQEAHEAIRPTNIENKTINIKNKDYIKLYNLIWTRTIASQMIGINSSIQSIIIHSNNGYEWIARYKYINCKGFTLIYDIKDDNIEIKKINISINDSLVFNNLKIIEEYNTIPKRYSESDLVKFLETKNIGRPSTYVSIINKIIDRNYINICNIDGINKNINIVELNKKFKIIETTKTIIIGNEEKKIIPTELGIKIINFLELHFNQLMNIDFTAEFETYLDKIADGSAKWYNVLDKFYKILDPIIKQLNTQPTYMGNILGELNNKPVEVLNGKYGLYIKYNNKNYSIQNKPDIINIEYAKELIEKTNILKTFIIKNKSIYIKNGKYGYYIQITNKKKNQNISIPKYIDINNIDLKKVLEIIADKNGTVCNN